MKKDNDVDFEIKKLKGLLKAQEDYLDSMYHEKERLLEDNKKLNNEISNLRRTISMDNNYINYLLNSFWWKISFPFRKISRTFKKNKRINYEFVENLSQINEKETIQEKVSVIIYTYNAGVLFEKLLKNISSQKLIKGVEIIVIDNGSTDKTLNIAKKYKSTIIKADNQLSQSEIYEKCITKISGKYVAVIEQNKLLNSNFWLYQAIRPIKDKKATSTIFFKDKNDINSKEFTYYSELKQRICNISDEKVLFFPENRDIIQYLSPYILDKSSIIVKERISNLFLI